MREISARQIRIPIMILVSFVLAMMLFATTGVNRAQAQTVTCDRWASNGGNDAFSGEQNAPVQTVGQLFAILTPGQTGCLTAGHTFNEYLTVQNTSGGEPGKPVTIRSEPGIDKARASFSGQLRILGDDITFTDIDFLGLPNRGASHLRLDADRIKFVGNNIKNPKGICLDIGDTTGDFGPIRADDFVLNRNRIHNCGTGVTDQTAEDSGVHAVYVINTLNAKITNNYIFDNQDRGIQLYPDADGTVIQYNVLDGNGTNLNIGSGEGFFSENTLARDNIITNATLPPITGTNTSQVHGNFPSPDDDLRYGNVVTENCLWYETESLRTYEKYFDGDGYVENNNKFMDPLYKDRVAKNFALQAGSPCADKGPQIGNVVPTITDMLPANGSSTTNTRPSLSATVKDDSTVLTKKDHIRLYVDGTLMGDTRYAYNSTTGELTRVFEDDLDPDFANGRHTIRIVATDAQGLSTTESTTFTVDTTAPRVGRLIPEKNATGVAPGANVRAFFSEAMRAGTINRTTVKLFKAGTTTRIGAVVSYDASTKRATLNPNARLRLGTRYKAVVTTGARDMAGNHLDQDQNPSNGKQSKVWLFTVRN